MTTLPAAGYISNAARTIAEEKQAFEDQRNAIAELPGASVEAALVIAGGNVTPAAQAGRIVNIDTETAAATDDLDHIIQTNTPDGSLCLIRSNNAGRTVVVRHAIGGGGQLLLADAVNLSLVSTKMWLLLQRRGTDWNEVLRFYGDQKAAALLFTGAAALAGAAFTGACSFTLAVAGMNVTFATADAGALGAQARFYHNTATPANADITGKLLFDGKDSGAADQTWAEIDCEIVDVVAATEDARLRLRTVIAGALDIRAYIGAGIYTKNVNGGDKGADTGNANEWNVRGNGLGAATINTQSGTTYTIVQNDLAATIKLTNAAGCTVTLPSIATVGAGWRCRIINAAVADVVVNRAGSDPIDGGGTTFSVQKDGGRNQLDIWTDGTTWYTSTRRFQSAAQTITAAGALTIAHGLGAVPRTVQMLLKNATAELNYAVNDEVMDWIGGRDQVGTGNRGISVIKNATNLVVRFGSSAATFAVLNATTGVDAAIVNANWNCILVAEF